MAFEFDYGYVWSFAFASGNQKLIDGSLENTIAYPNGSQPAQVIGSHVVARAWQAAGGEGGKVKSAALLRLTMRGTPFIYYGDEIGLRPGTQVVVDTRDSARTPMTWTSAGPGHGFTTGSPWIAFGEAPQETAVDLEDANLDSMLTYFRRLLAFRRGHSVWGSGALTIDASDNAQVVTFTRRDATESYFVAVNLTDADQTVTLTNAVASATLAFGEGTLAGDTLTVPASGHAIFALK
jgi:alpha-glucosidase